VSPSLNPSLCQRGTTTAVIYTKANVEVAVVPKKEEKKPFLAAIGPHCFLSSEK